MNAEKKADIPRIRNADGEIGCDPTDPKELIERALREMQEACERSDRALGSLHIYGVLHYPRRSGCL